MQTLTAARERRSTNPWIILAFLMGAVMLSFIDRQTLSVLIDPIRKDLAISDFQVGLLGGPAFVLFYIGGNLAGGAAADRRNRAALVAAALTLWSVATALCGLSRSFGVLLTTRAGVGLGEGALGPGVHSLIADSFDKTRLPFALSVYSISGSIGPGLALLLGGLIVRLAPHWFSGAPIIGALHPWQQVFVVVGLPGVALAALLLAVVRAPPRQHRPPATLSASLAEVAAFGRQRGALVVLFITAIGAFTAAELSLLLWLPSLLMRVHGFRPDQVGSTFGVMIMVLGASGSLAWGAAAVAGRHRRSDSALRVMTLAMAISAPFMVLAPLMPSGPLVLVLLAPVLACVRTYSGLGHAVVQLITPSWLRGRVAAIYLASASVIGAFIGPPLVGALSTYLIPGGRNVGVALSTVGGSLSCLGVLCLVLCLGPYRQAVALLDVTQSQAASD